MKTKLTTFIIATILACTMTMPIVIAQAANYNTDPAPTTVTQPASDGFRSFNLKSLRLTDSTGKAQTSAVFDRKDANGNKISPVVSAILYVTEFLTKVIGSISLLVLVGAGIFMITNHGEESQVTKGKDMFLYAILGLVFTFSAYFLTTIVQGIFIE